MKLHTRGKRFYLQRRVPKKYHAIERRRIIWISLSASTEKTAKLEATRKWRELQKYWEKLRLGATGDPSEHYRATRARAKKLGFQYLPVEKVAELPIDELVDRLKQTVDRDGNRNIDVANALLGGVRPPNPTFSVLLAQYLTHREDILVGKSRSQRQLWRQERVRATRYMIDFFGDVPVGTVGFDGPFDFYQHLGTKIQAGEISKGMANNVMSYADNILKLNKSIYGYDYDLTFRHTRRRIFRRYATEPFSDRLIIAKILAPNALEDLEPEARAILLGMVNTGYRLSEGANLLAENIKLNDPIPHIVIEPNFRSLKTISSCRKLPLFGVSLRAFERYPDGFPNYRDRRSLSQKLNRFLRNESLLENDSQTVRSFRHALSDRLVNNGTGSRIICKILGHRYRNTEYGQGASMEVVAKNLQDVALDCDLLS